MPRRPLHWWLCWWATFAAIDFWRDTRHDGSTLSECTRDLFHTNTRAGRLAFAAAWAMFSSWLVPHINRKEQA